MKYSKIQKITIVKNMIFYGGSFINNIGHALMTADSNNTKKIFETWPEECEKYLTFKTKTK